ncbi:MAG: thiamine pyrophosphate-dependent enzyme [Anaerolineales bacterium]|nr:thiamine pyrophosphate-dependent enzyme [Anaerolineales bacterium]
MPDFLSGTHAIAVGVLESDVSLVTGYPGSPATSVIDVICEMTSDLDSCSFGQVQVVWNSNEKTAAEMAFGASLAGARSLLCVKSVGFNIALDPLMTINLADCNAGFVILVADDPGGWSSQNEQDSRTVALATELPLLEPATILESFNIIPYAFYLSEEFKLPIIVRVTKPLILAETSQSNKRSPLSPSDYAPNGAEGSGLNNRSKQNSERFDHAVILPANVVANHNRLHNKLASIKTHFERSKFNQVEGAGTQGVLVTGFTYQNLLELFNNSIPPQLRIARLGSLHPLPDQFMITFLKSVEAVLILEETAPLLENAVRVNARQAGLTLPIYGRHSGDVPRVGELDSSQLAKAINCLLPGLITSSQPNTSRTMPSKRFYPSNCPYIPIFDALLEAITNYGPRQDTIIIGDPGCMVRGQNHYDLMDVKTSLGASISIAAGISSSFVQQNIQKRVIALSGDSGFLHTNFQGLVDAVQINSQMLVLILDNNTTALSGGQPHPGTRTQSIDRASQTIEIKKLAEDSGAAFVKVVKIDSGDDICSVITRGIDTQGVSVIIARGDCPGCP